MNLEKLIETKKAQVAIWGCGVLGATNVIYLSKCGFRCLGIDISHEKIEKLKNGKYDVKSDYDVLNFYYEPQFHAQFSLDYRDALTDDYVIHIICIPTERDGKPHDEMLWEVIEKILYNGRRKPFMIIIESTIIPYWIDLLYEKIEQNGLKLGSDIFIGTAPRRDLFGDKSFSLKNTNRVIGGNCEETVELLKKFYTHYCNKIIIAKDNKYAMMSKVVENMFRYFDVTITNLINSALNNYDLPHLMELSSSKWNMNLYHPSLGVGGYCIPLAPLYFNEELKSLGVSIPNQLSELIDYNEFYTQKMCDNMEPLFKGKRKIAILGISYIPNIKVLAGSITGKIVNYLMNKNYIVGVHDPYVQKDELPEIYKGSEWIDFPQGFTEYDVIILVTGHDYYNKENLKQYIQQDSIIIDNIGTLKQFDFDYYYQFGSKQYKGGDE